MMKAPSARQLSQLELQWLPAWTVLDSRLESSRLDSSRLSRLESTRVDSSRLSRVWTADGLTA